MRLFGFFFGLTLVIDSAERLRRLSEAAPCRLDRAPCRRRDIYLTRFSLPERGWIFQQIKKIAATTTAKFSIKSHGKSLDEDHPIFSWGGENENYS